MSVSANKPLLRQNDTCYQINDTWIYNSATQVVIREEKETKLRAKTAEVLNLLILNQGNVVTAQCFFDHVWSGKYVGENVLKQSIKELRSCFADESKTLISTITKQGYKLSAKICQYQKDVNSQLPADNKANDKKPENKATEGSSAGESISPISPEAENSHGLLPLPRQTTFPIQAGMKKSLQLGWLLAIGGILSFILLYLKFSQLQTQHQQQQLRLKSLSAEKQFFQDTVFRYYNTPQNNKTLLKSVLDKSRVQISEFSGPGTTKQGMQQALYELYYHGGYYKEARVLIGRIEQDTEQVYGRHSSEYIETKFATIDTLLKLRRRQEAYDVARHTLELTQNYHPDDKLLLAKAHLFAGRGYLHCMEPFCVRRESMNDGEQHTRIALALYREELPDDAIEIADTLYLLNWFLLDGEEKVVLVQDAICIYQEKLGRLHEKTAAAMEELGRILVFFDQQWAWGERYLLDAYKIRSKLYPKNHPKMAETHGKLGEHYLMLGQYTQAMEHLHTAIEVSKLINGEGNDNHLEYLMFLARAHLYNGEAPVAKALVVKAFDIIENHKMTPALLITRALEVTRLRIEQSQGKNTLSRDELLANITSATDSYRASASVLKHEYQTRLLAAYPDTDTYEYLVDFRRLLENLNPKSRYLYRSDLHFLKQRALSLCDRLGSEFCRQLAMEFKLAKVIMPPELTSPAPEEANQQADMLAISAREKPVFRTLTVTGEP
ncbi:tetratricopeptide repeat protein [Thalassomonas viridans]|uniref:Tetratricopeptide repeat protein n=1 Tax=Thalassomonas viridans TaxID=137584 RepID=A0AAF0C7A7_9GAMM|nr:tetratricopeptide repeat protein [Thalassomonas viridans]WDE03493.1 tetratricopeptide repeat protein [Thalassomonas viridans]